MTFVSTGVLSDYILFSVCCSCLLCREAVTVQTFKSIEISQVFTLFSLCSFTTRIKTCGMKKQYQEECTGCSQFKVKCD